MDVSRDTLRILIKVYTLSALSSLRFLLSDSDKNYNFIRFQRVFRKVSSTTLVSVFNMSFTTLFPTFHGTLISAFFRVFHFHKSTRKVSGTTLNICYNNICYFLLLVEFSDCPQSRYYFIIITVQRPVDEYEK
jgi:hypothetical protein